MREGIYVAKGNVFDGFEGWDPLRLVGFMHLAGLSRRDIADLLGLASVSTVSRWISGRTSPTRERILQLNAMMAMRAWLLQQERISRD